MPAALHGDLRARIAAWVDQEGLTHAEAAHRAGCCTKTVERIMDVVHEYGTVFPPYLRMRGRPRQLTEDDVEFIIAKLSQSPGMLLDELQDHLIEVRDIYVTLSTLDRTLVRLGETRKIMRKVAAERDDALRDVHERHMGLEYGLRTELFVTIDETAVDIDVGRKRYGRSVAGTRAVKSEIFNHHGTRYSILPALASSGVLAWRIYEGGVTKEQFVDFLRQELVRICPLF
jgi:transposase